MYFNSPPPHNKSHRSLCSKLTRKALAEYGGVHVQLWGFKNLGGDVFLGEVVIPWEDVAAACQKDPADETTVSLNTRDWLKASKREQLVQGALTYSMAFRETHFNDFGGFSVVPLIKKVTKG